MYEVKDLVFSYPKGKKKAVDGISLSVEEGTIFGLLGPSGAGKSTTQKILCKLLSGYSGSIIFRGKDLKEYDKSFYENVGVGFELPVHFNKLTALENLKFFASLYKKNADYEKLLTKLGLYDARNQMVGEFSKGMKIRLNLIRALVNDPEVLFLDEPTAGLDPANAKIVKDIILDCRKQGKTVFVTTHLMGDVEQLCDHVVFMNEGGITETSTVHDLKMKYGKREIIVGYYEGKSLKNRTFPMQGIGNNVDFANLIKEKEIDTIHSGETTLEDIFIKVTGGSINHE
ncbi:MAG TPA: ABC transporter ATP-binding protein [Bacillota bacterium]|nr:ABC transporter ATP-binding protein [Bacillota bacterium]HPQ62518.1 ABC transporter ATP-binding protein [Bacillota bacterium]